MVEVNSIPLEQKRDGMSANEVIYQKGSGRAVKESAEQGVPKPGGRADDPPQLVVETETAVDPDTGATSGGGTLDSFESEIERMSKDADAILDSIRNEVAGSPKEMHRAAGERRDRREAINKANDSDDDWDDDMSEELVRLGSVSEEMRQAEIDFMRGLTDHSVNAASDTKENETETENEPPLHSDEEEGDDETPLHTLSLEIKTDAQEKVTEKKKKMKTPLQQSLQQPLQTRSEKPLQKQPQQKQVQKSTQQQVQKPLQTTVQQQVQKPTTQTKGRVDSSLLVGVVLVWLVIMIHVLRVFRDGLLDANGGLMPILSLQI
jgi:hypothetical protein